MAVSDVQSMSSCGCEDFSSVLKTPLGGKIPFTEKGGENKTCLLHNFPCFFSCLFVETEFLCETVLAVLELDL